MEGGDGKEEEAHPSFALEGGVKGGEEEGDRRLSRGKSPRC